jgi:hypothetical protein
MSLEDHRAALTQAETRRVEFVRAVGEATACEFTPPERITDSDVVLDAVRATAARLLKTHDLFGMASDQAVAMAIKLTALRAALTQSAEKLAAAEELAALSIRRLAEATEPGFIGAFAARDQWQERAEKAEASLATMTRKLTVAADSLAVMFQRNPYCPKGYALNGDCAPDCSWAVVHNWFMAGGSSPDLMGPLTPKEYSIAMRAIQERAEKAERERDEARRGHAEAEMWWNSRSARLERTVESLSAIVNPMLDDRTAFGHLARRQVGKEIHLLFRAQEFSDRFWAAINTLLTASSPDHAGRMRRCILMVNSAGDAHAVITQAAPGYVPGLHEVYAWFEAPDHAGAPAPVRYVAPYNPNEYNPDSGPSVEAGEGDK